MLAPDFALGDRETRQLLKQYRGLGPDDRRSVRDYVEFLAARHRPPPGPAEVSEPVLEPRPASESVVAAIKRLSRAYPMLDRERMLGETSALMAGHLLQGRPAAEVIDDLEAMFDKHYQQLRTHDDV